MGSQLPWRGMVRQPKLSLGEETRCKPLSRGGSVYLAPRGFSVCTATLSLEYFLLYCSVYMGSLPLRRQLGTPFVHVKNHCRSTSNTQHAVRRRSVAPALHPKLGTRGVSM